MPIPLMASSRSYLSAEHISTTRHNRPERRLSALSPENGFPAVDAEICQSIRFPNGGATVLSVRSATVRTLSRRSREKRSAPRSLNPFRRLLEPPTSQPFCRFVPNSFPDARVRHPTTRSRLMAKYTSPSPLHDLVFPHLRIALLRPEITLSPPLLNRARSSRRTGFLRSTIIIITEVHHNCTYIFSSACSRSAIKSSACSVPTERRIVPG